MRDCFIICIARVRVQYRVSESLSNKNAELTNVMTLINPKQGEYFAIDPTMAYFFAKIESFFDMQFFLRFFFRVTASKTFFIPFYLNSAEISHPIRDASLGCETICFGAFALIFLWLFFDISEYSRTFAKKNVTMETIEARSQRDNDDFDAVYDAWFEDVVDCIHEPEAIYLTKSDFDNPLKRFSFADFLRIPESNRIMEIMNGVLSLFAAPVTNHAYVTTVLSHRLLGFIEKKKGPCRVFHNPFCVRLAPDGATDNDKIYNVVQPDICVICDLSKLDRVGCFGPPDLIIEVISPKHRKRDVVEKFNLYEASGVREYWIIDPKAKTTKVFLLQPDGRYDAGTVYNRNQKAPVHILEGLEIDLNLLFEDYS